MLIGMGAITISCKKEQPAQRLKAQMTTAQAKDGGDDDEDPVIRGKVKKNNLALFGAEVETVTYGTNVRIGSVYTDSLGEFAQHVSKGTYYFKVTVPGFSTPYVTDTVSVTKDTEVNISVD
jgi:hypothetical protein